MFSSHRHAPARLRHLLNTGAAATVFAASVLTASVLAASVLAATPLRAAESGSKAASPATVEVSPFTAPQWTGDWLAGPALPYTPPRRVKTTAFEKIEPPPQAEPIADSRIWAQAVSGVGRLKANSATGARAERSSNIGLAAGVDTELDTNLRIGFALSGGQAQTKVVTLTDKSDAAWGQATAYAVMTDGRFYSRTSLSIGYISTDTERDVATSGVTERATGAYDSLLYAARLEMGRRFDRQRLSLTPFVAFEPSLTAQNGYVEKGPASPETFDKKTVSALPGTLGVKIDGGLDLRKYRITPSATLGWVHQFANSSAVSPFFTELPGPQFSFQGAEGDRNLARAEFNIGANQIGSMARVYANARADFGQRTTNLRGAGGMMLRF